MSILWESFWIFIFSFPTDREDTIGQAVVAAAPARKRAEGLRRAPPAAAGPGAWPGD